MKKGWFVFLIYMICQVSFLQAPVLSAQATQAPSVITGERGVGVRTAPITSDPDRLLTNKLMIGKQYLYLIAINRYRYWTPLGHPVNDALELRDILLNSYQFDTVIELYDEQATKTNIIKEFEKLQSKLGVDDSLLVFYAGHGHLDATTRTGYWIPANAGLDRYEQSGWIPNTVIKGLIAGFKASHICLLVDSCFAGDILDIERASPPDEPRGSSYFSKAYALTSRQVLTSGTLETVPDTSEFAVQLKMALRKNKEVYLDPLVLFNEIRLGVKKTRPLMGVLKETGHQDGGCFLLFPRETYRQTESKGVNDEDAAGENYPVAETVKPGNGIQSVSGALVAGVAGIVPMGKTAAILFPGFLTLTGFSWPFAFPGGNISPGLRIFSVVLPSRKDVSTPYLLFSIPLTFNLEYRYRFTEHLFLLLECNFGLSFNFIDYTHSVSRDVPDSFSTKPVLLPAIGAGYNFSRQFSLAVTIMGTIIFFDDQPATGIATGLAAQYKL